MNNKWIKLSAMLLATGAFLGQGCLSAFVDGVFNSGFPNGDGALNRTLNIAIDILNEELFG